MYEEHSNDFSQIRVEPSLLCYHIVNPVTKIDSITDWANVKSYCA